MKRTKKYLRSWAVAHALGYPVPPERPAHNAPVEEKRKARNGLHAFQMAVARGTAPSPDIKRGGRSLWNEETLDKWFEAQEDETKKPGKRANAHRAKSTLHVNEAVDEEMIPRLTRDVNAKDEVPNDGA